MSALPVIACCRPLAAPTLSDEEAEATAQLFKALGDPARVKILNALATSDEPVCVCELIPAVGLSQPTVSHHLKKLTEAGLLAREQRGVWAYYSIDPAAAERLGAVADLKGER
jgi:ArsR family transcriptional regulator